LTDYTYEVAALVDARFRMSQAKKQIKAEEEHKALQAAKIRIAERTEEVEAAFARELAKAVDSGIPQAVIRREVLRTNSWDRWVYWRDLAKIEPERVKIASRKNAEAAKASGVEWAEDYSTLTFTKNSRGEDIRPIVYDMSTLRRTAKGNWWPDPVGSNGDLTEEEREAMRDDNGYLKMLDAEIQRRIDDGSILDPEAENG